MKMSSPTELTITSITAARGSRTQPRSTAEWPNCSQVKLTVSRTTAPWAQPLRTCAKAMSDKSSENPREPMASVDANLRRGCLSSAMIPEATIGTAGISHKFLAIEEAANWGVNAADCSIKLSPLHPVDLVEFCGVRVAIDGNHEPQAHGSLGCGHSNGKNGEHHAGERLGMRAEAPECDQI